MDKKVEVGKSISLLNWFRCMSEDCNLCKHGILVHGSGEVVAENPFAGQELKLRTVIFLFQSDQYPTSVYNESYCPILFLFYVE